MARLKLKFSQEEIAKEFDRQLADMIDQASDTGQIIVCLTPKAREMVNKRIAERFPGQQTGNLRKPTVMMKDEYEKTFNKKAEAANLLTHTRH